MFLNVCSASSLMRVEVVDCVVCSQLSVIFEADLEKVLQTAQTSRISRQTWALLWLVILATWKFGGYCS